MKLSGILDVAIRAMMIMKIGLNRYAPKAIEMPKFEKL